MRDLYHIYLWDHGTKFVTLFNFGIKDQKFGYKNGISDELKNIPRSNPITCKTKLMVMVDVSVCDEAYERGIFLQLQ